MRLGAQLNLSNLNGQEGLEQLCRKYSGNFQDFLVNPVPRTISDPASLHTHSWVAQKLRACDSKKGPLKGLAYEGQYCPLISGVPDPLRILSRHCNRWYKSPYLGRGTCSEEAAALLLPLPLSFWIKTIMLIRATGPGQPSLPLQDNCE